MAALVRLVIPAGGTVAFFALAWTTVRVIRPKEPRKFFLVYALALLPLAAWLSTRLWPVVLVDDAVLLAAELLLQLLACFTIWNSFYSILWGFSGSLMHDLVTDPAVRHRERLIASYEAGEGGVDRMMARRLPNLVRGGWIDYERRTLTIRPKGRWIAMGTMAAYKVFSLGMGGGVK